MAGRRVGYSVRKRGSGRWQVRVLNADGRFVGVGSFELKRDAERFGQEEATRVAGGQWVDPTKADVRLDVWLAQSLERRARAGRHGDRHSDDSARLVRLHIAPYIGAVRLTDLAPAVVAQWYDELVATRIAESGTPGLIPAKAYRVLHAAMQQAVRDQLIVRNPCMIEAGGVERSPERPLLELADVVAIADEVRPQWRALVLVAAISGLRFGEAAGLRRRDVDGLRSRLIVTRALAETSDGVVAQGPKAGSQRVVDVPRALMDVLEAHMEEYTAPGPDALAFTSPRGSALRRSNFGPEWRDAVRRAGHDGVHFHDLRHVAGTTLAQHGATTRELMAFLGHRSQRAAQIYQHAAERRGAELAERVGETLEGALRSKEGVPPPVVVAQPWPTRPAGDTP